VPLLARPNWVIESPLGTASAGQAVPTLGTTLFLPVRSSGTILGDSGIKSFTIPEQIV
jgi:hypothetical protein